MFKNQLQYDYQFMSAQKVGKFGFQQKDLNTLLKKLRSINQDFKARKNEPVFSFRKLPYETKTIKQVENLSRKLKKKFNTLVVVGIGGSNLGAKAVYNCLAGYYANQSVKQKYKIYFLGDTTDPRPLADLLQIIDLKKTVFQIVSKSGSTIEPLANFLYLREAVIKTVGYKKHQDHFIITTNKEKGSLLELVYKEGYRLLAHHQSGGRFSVLSVNGLLPAVWAGLKTADLLAGARVIDKISNLNTKNNLPFVFAALQCLAYLKKKQSVHVLMPYDYYLFEYSNWWRQLWGESLSNKFNLKNKKVNLGITPVANLGPTDQHSQIQLMIEGPFDKIISFIVTEKNNIKMKIPKYPDSQSAYLGGHKFKEVLDIEHRATAVSLMKNQRPNQTLIIPEVNEFYLGQLFYFMEMATLYLGELLQVNVTDQPGVEQSKHFMYGLLGKEGYDKFKKEIENI